jgi:hypothetical protein
MTLPKSGMTKTSSRETNRSRSESLRLLRCFFLRGDGITVNYVLLVAALTLVWAVYASVRVGPWLANRWKAWGEVAAFLVFTAVELGLLVTFLKPS